MSKRVIFGIVFFVFLVGGLYYMSRMEAEDYEAPQANNEAPEVFKAASEKIKQKQMDLAQETPAKDMQEVDNNDKGKGKIQIGRLTEPMTEEEMEVLENYFDQVEEEWENRIETMFTSEFGLSKKEIEEYEKMREGFEQDKMDAYEDFHAMMVEKHGENYSYNPSDDELSFEKDIKKRYEDSLINLLGDDNYKRYLEVRDRYNEDLERNQNPDVGYITIEF